MSESPSPERLLHYLREALRMADELNMTDVAIDLDGAINKIDGDDTVLRDSAERIRRLLD